MTDPDDVGRNRGAGAPRGAGVFADGHLVAGRYSITRLIGVGGASEVYEAFDGGLGVRVALKVLSPLHAQDAVQLERFRREIQSARKVTHRNVCRIFDLGVEQLGNTKRFFLTMELLHGSTLAEAMAGDRCFAPADALPIATQIAEGLQAAHDAGVIHRDLKPGNVILVPPATAGTVPESPPPPAGSRAVITDFGLALSDEQTRLTRSDELVGTPAYMAPEQSEPGQLTAAADIYALGLIMYEMLTAQTPFDAGATPLATVLLRKRVPPRPVRELMPDIDPAWETTVHRCLERIPDDRFARAMDIVTSLHGAPAPRKPRRSKR